MSNAKPVGKPYKTWAGAIKRAQAEQARERGFRYFVQPAFDGRFLVMREKLNDQTIDKPIST